MKILRKMPRQISKKLQLNRISHIRNLLYDLIKRVKGFNLSHVFDIKNLPDMKEGGRL